MTDANRRYMRRRRSAPPDLAPEVALDLAQRAQDGYTPPTLAAYLRMDEQLVRVWLRYHPEPVRRWAPLCMSADEWDFWTRMQMAQQREHRTPRPCDDCGAAFAAENRAAGTCNGTLPDERRP